MPLETDLEGTPGEWTFDRPVADAFDDMLARSIPDYEGMRELVVAVAGAFLSRRSPTYEPRILDLGTSRGETIARLWDRYGISCRYVGVDTSGPMLAAAQARFNREYVTIAECDLRTDWPSGTFDLILAVLTLMFVPIEYRQAVVERAHDSLRPGGGLIVVEKVLGASARIDRLLVDAHHAAKRDAGYSEEEVVRKRAALEGVLVPVTSRWNLELLEAAGFRGPDRFWRRLNFEGYVAIRD